MTERSPLPRAADVVVIGAGAIGCSIAYHLAKRGQRGVVVLERDAVGAGSTSKAAGGIRCQWAHEVEMRFSIESLRFFERFEDEMGVPCDFHREGYLFLLFDEADVARYRQAIAMQKAMGVDVRLLGPDDLRALVPDVRVDDVLAAAWGPNDGHASPNDVVQAYARRARELGARIFEETAVTGLRLTGGRVAAVETTRGSISPGVVVDAAGPQAAIVGRMAGLDLPVHPRRRHVFVTGDFERVRHPMPLVIDRGSGFYVRSEGRSLLMSPGDAEDVADPAQPPAVDWGKLEETVAKAVRRVPVVESAGVRSAWAGLRPLTPDEHAILDWAPGVANMLCAVGFCGHGFQHSPAAGATVAEMILDDGRTSIDIAPLRLARFAGGPMRARTRDGAD
ncbi:MAG TPA: FAD-binding oxidoreductase [Chloroflexota bacterium]|nr:FAD-binding oxidoreductase [Chloroflexota bacterium]